MQYAYLITVPTDLIAQVSAPASGILTDLMPIATLVIGIALGIFIINWGISLFRRRHQDEF